jgi:hypothetical protein
LRFIGSQVASGAEMENPSDRGPRPGSITRKSQRVHLSAEIMSRRTGQHSYRVKVFDVSPQGCKAEFVDRPKLDEHVWVKFEGLEGLGAMVCWVRGFEVGLEFENPIHSAVFDLLVAKLTK